MDLELVPLASPLTQQQEERLSLLIREANDLTIAETVEMRRLIAQDAAYRRYRKACPTPP